MAQVFSASIYGANGNDWNKPQGVTMGFASQSVVIRQLDTPTTYSGVSCLTQIQLLPTAPSPIQPVYYCPTAIATVITAANA